MKTHDLQRTLGTADPVGRGRLDGIDLGAMEADLLADLEAGFAPLLESAAPRSRLLPRRRFVLAFGSAVLALALAAVFFLAGGGSERASRAYAAELVRFAEATPLLLLEGPGWRVHDVAEYGGGEGTMEFITGRPLPPEALTATGNVETGQYVSGLAPAAVRQRKVDLRWSRGSLAETLAFARKGYHAHGQHWTTAPVLETTAHLDTRAEVYINQGGPGDRQMTALWSEDGYVLEMRAAVPDLAAMEERLEWITRVDSQTWLDAMPASVVKAADHDATVREMLQGIPLPDTFAPSRIPDEGLTTNRGQVAGAVTGTVACLWFRQWGTARRTGDAASKLEAERAMATSKRWPILREISKDGAYPLTIWQLAAAMPSGEWRRGWRLLPHAEALGCARLGIPVLPWKQRRQNERGGI